MTSFGLYATVVDIDDDTNVATIDAGGGTTLSGAPPGADQGGRR